MTIYGKPGHSLENRKLFLHKILHLSVIILILVIILDVLLITLFDTEIWKIVVGSIFAMFLMKRDLVGIIEGFREISKLERNIDKGLSGEIKVAKILNEIANKDEKICVFHDIFMGFENIDHLVIYDNRILIVIETKSSSKFPYGLRLINLISQIRRQWNFLHNQTGLYIHPLGVFTEAHVEPFKRVKEIELINISYLERKIKRIIAEDTRSHLNHDAIIKIQEIQKKYINKELSYLTLLVG